MPRRGNKTAALVRAAGVLGIVLATVVREADAQSAWMAGPTLYDLAGTGTGMVVATQRRDHLAPRLSFVVAASFFVESSSPGAGPGAPSVTSTLLFPEVRLEVAPLPRSGRIQPFVGAGGGAGIRVGGRQSGGFTLHATAGLRLSLSDRFALTASGLARTVRPWRGTTVDLLVGFELSRPPTGS